MLRTLLLTGVFLEVAGATTLVEAQVVGQEPEVLAGVEAVDAQISITWDDPITENGGPGLAVYEQGFEEKTRSRRDW